MSKKLTTEEFVIKAKKVHGEDTYGYGNVVYVNNRTPVSIDCPTHGPFEQIPNSHLNGSGCKQCGIEARTLKQSSSTEEFIKKAKKVHGEDTYGYGDIVYINNRTQITIDCPTHGSFKQMPSDHLTGSGCPGCSGTKKLSTEDFIYKAKEVHGKDTYGYDGVMYINSRTPVSINCSIHGPFSQTPKDHLNGSGCKQCGIEARALKRLSSTEEFIIKAKEVHGEDTYGYGNVVYINSITPVSIDCHIHGPFKQMPNSHLNGKGCKDCGIAKNIMNQSSSTEEFIIKAKEVHGEDTYGYGNVVYVNAHTKVSIDCHIHGLFEQTPNIHLKGSGCKACSKRPKHSKIGIKWLEEEMKKEGIFIQHAENGGEYIIPGTNYEADGYCKETNTIYEFHGDYWHGNPKFYLSEDINPSSKQTYGELYTATIARENHIRSLGYNLVVIWEHEYVK